MFVGACCANPPPGILVWVPPALQLPAEAHYTRIDYRFPALVEGGSPGDLFGGAPDADQADQATESQLGVRLFTRSHARMTFTTAGQVLANSTPRRAVGLGSSTAGDQGRRQ